MTSTEEKTLNLNFCKTLVILYREIAVIHLKKWTDDIKSDIKYDDIGDDREKAVKRIFNRYINIHEHLEKIEKTPIYLDANELIPILKQKGIEEVEFYQYVFENFIIRITTTLDLCGKLGNEVYQLNIAEKDCNWHVFAHNKQMKETDCSKKLIEFSDYLNQTKAHRHTIIHYGGYKSEEVSSIDSTIYRLEDIVPLEEPLKEWFDQRREDEMRKQINALNIKISKVIDYTCEFLETLNDKLKDYKLLKPE
ncbi:MAG: Cthe_2314 family HEPN domain-containing protein [Bacteroidia bacterium]